MSEGDSKQPSQAVPRRLTGNTESQPISGAAAEQLHPIYVPKKLKLHKEEHLCILATATTKGSMACKSCV